MNIQRLGRKITMNSHRPFALIAVMIVTASSWMYGQSTINVYGINSSAFPKITADYIALDASGNPITDLVARDFRVVETPQGSPANDLTATVTHECKEEQSDPQSSIIIILDRSNSMRDQVGGRTRFEYAKDAIRGFVDRIKFVGETRVCLVTFSGAYDVIVDWTNNPQLVKDSLRLMQPQTSTDYRLPFDTPESNIYEMFKKRPANIPKYAFFLTDGHPNPAIPDENKFVSDNTLKLQAQGIRFFSVTILEDFTHWTLASLARATGGKSIVTDEAKLVDLFSLLALETQIKKLCQISWISPYSCSEQGQNRAVQITMLRAPNPQANTSYIAPPTSVARTLVSDPVLFCGDPPPSNQSFGNVTITAVNSPLTVTNFTITPATYFQVVDWNFPTNQSTFAPFNLATGAKRVIRVRFSQGPVQAFRQAGLTLTGSPCPPSIILVGGTGLILLQSPVGGELFSTCDTVSIKWAGVLPTQPVTIDYSENGGTTWSNITRTATGLTYKWLPPRAGVTYRIRVSVSPASQYVWAKQLGGAGAETATSVAVTRDGLKVYASGWVDGPTQIGTATSSNLAGNNDGYLAELDSDGNFVKTMLLSGTGSNDERVIGVVTDTLGNYYVAGYFSSGTSDFGGFPLSRAPLDTRNMFVYKFAPNGNLIWSNTSRGSNTSSSNADATDLGIRYSSGFIEIFVVGRFERYIEVGINRSGAVERAGPYTNSTPRPYYVIYDEAGYPRLTANATPPAMGVSWKSKRALDTLGFTYDTDSYRGPRSFSPPTITLPNLGLDDAFVTKNGATPASSAMSPANFSVKSPQLQFQVSLISFAPTPQGQVVARTGVFINNGDFPVTIVDARVAGANAADFRIISQLIGRRIDRGQTGTVEIEFSPTGTGPRSALIEIVGSCNANAQILVEGVGLAPCVWENQTVVNIGKFPLARPVQRAVTCVLKNTGPLPLTGRLSVITSNPEIVVSTLGNFTLNANGGCLDVTLDISAATAGVKTVQLGFGLPAECGAPVTTVTLEIVEPRVTIDSIDFGRIRVLTPAVGRIRITNLNDDQATINALSLSDPASTDFAFTIPATPFNLAPGAHVDVPVTYTPQTRGPHSINLLCTILGQATQIIGEARGVGFQPVVKATGYAFNPWTINNTSPETGKVVIANTDDDSPLTIESVGFETPTTVFAWTTALPTFPITILPGAPPLELSVSFTPNVTGVNQVRVCINHDAKPGPGPIPPYAQMCVDVTGIGLDPSALPPIDFGKVLTCVTSTQTFTITNPSAQFPLNCLAPTVTGDRASFAIDQTADFTIPAGGTSTLTVTFTPTAIGLQSATYTFGNDQALKLSVTALGEGVTEPVAFRFENIVSGMVGRAVSMPIVTTFNDANVAPAQVASFTITLTHHPDFVSFNSLVPPQLAGWTFAETVTRGQVSILATSNGTPFTQGNFITPSFDIYLNANTALPVTMSVVSPKSCIVVTGDNGSIEMKEMCFANGRLVNFSKQNFGLQAPKGNPVSENLAVEYSTGLTVATTFQIINSVGAVVLESTTPVLPSGSYIFEYNVHEFGTGVYSLMMTSGPYVSSTRFVVVR